MKRIISLGAAAVVCLTPLLPVSASAEAFTSRVEAEWCEMTNIPVSENGENNLPVYRSAATFSNGLAVNLTDSTEMPEENWYMSFEFIVNADGIYNISFMTSTAESQYTSPYTVSLNSGEPISVQSGMKVENGYNENWAKYRISTYLEKGKNTITFRVTDYTASSKKSSPKAVFYFDYFDTEYSANQDIRAEGESFFDPSSSGGIAAVTDTTAGSLLTGDKRYLRISGAALNGEESKSVKLQVYSPRSGEFKMNTICTKLGVSYTGLWDLTDQNGNVYPITTETASFIRDVVPSPSNACSEYNLNTPIHLEAGYNTFTVTAYKRSTGDFATFIDYIKFSEAEKGSLVIEAESCAEPGYWTASNGSLTLNQTDAVWGYDPVGAAFEVYYDFGVTEENNYHFYFDMAAANASNKYVSRMEISIDGSSWVAFDTDNLSYFSESTSGISATYTPALYLYERGFHLTEGGHNIGIRVIEPIARDDVRLTYYAAIDKIMVLPDDRAAESAKMSIGVPYLRIGEIAEPTISVTDNYGSAIDSDDFSFTYESDNNKVVSVGDDGVITAMRCGNANITVYADSEFWGGTSATIPVTVISDVQGIYVTESERTGDVLTVKLINPNHTDSSAMLIAVEYENGQGAEKLTGVHEIDMSATIGKVGENELRGIMEKTYTIQLDHADSKVDLYFWNNIDDMISLWSGSAG